MDDPELSLWGGATAVPSREHELAIVLALVLPRLAPDARIKAACVCRSWRDASADPALWADYDCGACARAVDDERLAALCARAGAALRTLTLPVSSRVTGPGVLDALRQGGCLGLRRLCAIDVLLPLETACELHTACPRLEHAAFVLDFWEGHAEYLNTGEFDALPGPMTLRLDAWSATRDDSDALLRLITGGVTSLDVSCGWCLKSWRLGCALRWTATQR